VEAHGLTRRTSSWDSGVHLPLGYVAPTMGSDAWFTLAVVAAMLALMVRGHSAAVSIVGAVVMLLVAGVIDQKQAFSGFSNAAPITVAALYVVARGVERTGALEPLVRAAIGKTAGGAPSLLRMLAPSAAASAFLNNTPIVAMLMPTVCNWSEAHHVPASRLLMPLSFAVILGGVVTAIGTSTNLVVSGLLQASGQEPFSLFEMSHVGLPIALIGLLLVSLLAPRLLPDRESPRRRLSATERDFVVRMIVDESGELAGSSVEDAGLRHLEGVFLVEIERDGEPIAPVAPTTLLHAGDQLVFVGQARLVADLRNLPGLRSAERPHLDYLETPAHRLVEVVVGAGSPLLGRTPKQIGFRARYDAAIVGIHREGQPVAAKLGEVKFRLGDTLLVLTDPGFRERWRDRPDFLLISPLDATLPPLGRRGYLALAITLGVVVTAASGLVPILHAALAGAVLLVATRTLSALEARASIDIEVLVVIAAAFGVGAAIEQSGLASLLGHQVVALTEGLGWRWSLLGIVLATVVLTEFISNNAAAVLMFPIAMATAAEVGAEARGFAIAVAVSASCSFVTPIGYQTNTMVYGPGGYRFGDYWRLGAPLTLVAITTVVLTV
jgi:di/tricarboxylate transporter